jgi:hypothetical protein
MEMEIEIHRRAKALDEGDRAALLGSNPPVPSAAPAQLGEKGPQEGAEFLLDEAGHGMPAFGRPGQEALELLANRPVEEGLLGAVGV